MFMEYWNELYFYDFPEIVSSWKVAGQRLIFAGVSPPSTPWYERRTQYRVWHCNQEAIAQKNAQFCAPEILYWLVPCILVMRMYTVSATDHAFHSIFAATSVDGGVTIK